MELCYSFVAVLVETVPRYELQWLAGLIALSNRRKGMEDDDWEQRIWQSVGFRSSTADCGENAFRIPPLYQQNLSSRCSSFKQRQWYEVT
ncbi:uncharacterized protein BDCG_17575 [Blastomyces dermatitidis ER-3]|uniref:Uncharacterized protein n=1 Tax=Ajellomyces dermatitidis (strain ER-3 / ATCC MYA-2586) TaxID=559297 RepID=A0ABX2VZA2_AJEDR|nr:uncharacterized protein BDCG_17575 [Blastomyces dermatitidis ER-3]OAT02468.1 hypothetical protein BDCG_17575 [Blastomyces dermatitidis ER-3]